MRLLKNIGENGKTIKHCFMLSIIVCTYNRDKYLYNALKSVAENDFSFDKYEIVLINNNSTDRTESECERFQNDFPQVNFNYFVENNQGLSLARNRGIDEAKGDILVYVDDDATVNSAYLKSIDDFFKDHQAVMAVGGPIFPVYETEEPAWMSYYTKVLITTYKDEGNKIRKFKGDKFPSGGNAAYKKIAFEKTGKFNTELGRKGASLIGAEEKDLFMKMKVLNMPIYYLPDMVLYHIIPSTKLTRAYFNNLTLSLGQSERIRTLHISKATYFKRLFAELIKWTASFVLFIGFCFIFQSQKGTKLLLFRWNVTKGLLINHTN